MNAMSHTVVGVVLICLGLLFVTPYVSPKLLFMILGIYLIVQGVQLIQNKKNF